MVYLGRHVHEAFCCVFDIGFEIKGLEAFCKKLEADGVKFEIPYRDVPQIGLKLAFITDPMGTRIELTEGLAAH